MTTVRPDILKGYSAFVFDMDGLLVDTERLSFEAWRQVGADLGYTITQDIFASIVGTTGEESHIRLRRSLGDDFPAEELRKLRTVVFESRIEREGLPTLDGAVELLTALKANNKLLALATSTKQPNVTRRLIASGLIGFFDVIVSGDLVENLKPAPDIYLRAAELLKVSPKHCLAFEDSGLGVEAARAAGMDVFMVPNIYQPNEEDKSRATEMINSLRTLLFE